jgi:hypothetical protein
VGRNKLEGKKVKREDEEGEEEGVEDQNGLFVGPHVFKIQNRKLHRNSRPWEMCQIQYNQTMKNKSPKIKPKLNRYLVSTKKKQVHKKTPKDRLAHGGRCTSP